MHPQVERSLQAVWERNRAALSLLNALLDEAVQETYAYWSERCKLADLHGQVFSNHVRQLMWCSWTQRAPSDSTMCVASRGRKWHTLTFCDQQAIRFKVRMHPRKLYTCELLPVTDVPETDLFGSVWPDLSCSYYVFFDGHSPSQMLSHSYLAAAAHIDVQDDQVIYGRVSLPTDKHVERHDDTRPDPAEDHTDDPWDGLWSDEEGTGDDEPA